MNTVQIVGSDLNFPIFEGDGVTGNIVVARTGDLSADASLQVSILPSPTYKDKVSDDDFIGGLPQADVLFPAGVAEVTVQLFINLENDTDVEVVAPLPYEAGELTLTNVPAGLTEILVASDAPFSTEIAFYDDDEFYVRALDQRYAVNEDNEAGTEFELVDFFASDNFGDLILEIVSPPDSGTATIFEASGQFGDQVYDTVTYIPDPDFSGEDTFTYRFIGPNGEVGNTATITDVAATSGTAQVADDGILFTATGPDATLTYTVSDGMDKATGDVTLDVTFRQDDAEDDMPPLTEDAVTEDDVAGDDGDGASEDDANDVTMGTDDDPIIPDTPAEETGDVAGADDSEDGDSEDGDSENDDIGSFADSLVGVLAAFGLLLAFATFAG